MIFGLYIVLLFLGSRGGSIIIIKLSIILLIPFRKIAQTFPQRYPRRKAKVALQGRCIGVCGRHVTWLHCDKLFVGIEVVVLRQHAGSDKLLLKYLYKIQQVLRLAAADVVDSVWRNGQAVLAPLALGSTAHHPYYSFNNIINIGEVATAVAVVVDLYRLARQQLVGEAKIGHIGTSGRAVDSEKAQARGGNFV